MKHRLALLFIVFTLVLQGQESLGALSLKYPFLDTTKQSLQYFGSEDALESFFEKLDRTIFEGEGKVNIVHMGGSHVQGGTLSHTMRMNLAQLAPELNVERGFFFPHRLANTNMPGNIYVKKIGTWEGCRNSIPRNNCPWGFSGIDAITRDKDAGFAVQSFSGPGEAYAFKELRVFEHYQSNTMVPICTPTPDSTYVDTAAGVRCWYFNTLIDSVAVSFDATQEGESQYTLQGLQMVRDEPGLIYHALGVNGAATKSFLRSENFISRGRMWHPTWSYLDWELMMHINQIAIGIQRIIRHDTIHLWIGFAALIQIALLFL
ncbi:MAG: hypothetical protein P8I37_04955 [Schleiferiaceae bacterium]|nr:hypothetical protein [Schleiferiaceae bacterium]